MDMVNLTSGLLGALLGAIAGSVATVLAQWFKEGRETKAKTYADLYCMWFDLVRMRGGFGLVHHEEERRERKITLSNEEHRQFTDLCHRIFAELRKVDELPEGGPMLHAMYDDYEFETERQRMEALVLIRDQLGKRVSPRLTAIMQAIWAQSAVNFGREADRQYREMSERFRQSLPESVRGSVPDPTADTNR